MKKNYTIELFGKKLNLLSENEAPYVQKLTKELTKRVNEVRLSGGTVSTSDALLVVALDLLDENFRLKSLIENSEDAK